MNNIKSDLITTICEKLSVRLQEKKVPVSWAIDNIISPLDDTIEYPEILEIHHLVTDSDILTDGDLLGLTYQKLESKEAKNRKGQYFTDQDIVDHMLSEIFTSTLNVADLENLKILDPACGSGQFLISAYKILTNILNTENDPFIKQKIISSLNGFDIDATAVTICRYNLSKLSSLPVSKIRNVTQTDFIYKDHLSFTQSNIESQQYDFIIGNPPWGSVLTSEEKKLFRKTYSSARSGINTFTLFTERSLELLKEGGRLSFLIPEAFLNIKAHSACRNLVLTKTVIDSITLWGDRFEKVYAPSVTLSCTKNNSLRKTNSITILNKSNNQSFSNLIVNQKNLLQTHQNIISIHFTNQTLDIITHIQSQDCFYLKDNAKFFLGIVTGNNPHFLQNSYDEKHPDPIIIGKDISKYKVNYSGKHFCFDQSSLQQTAPQHLYKSMNKIVYKFIGKKLTFALEENGMYMLNNVNGFIPDMETVSPEAMLAVLNSSLIQYFYEKNFFTLRVLKGNLEKLPLRTLSKDAEKLLSDLARQTSSSDSLAEMKINQDRIDDIVFHEYNIKDKEAYYIWEEFNSDKSQQTLPNL